MKKNAFTLIELLAVIVILAVIALIATPLILNTIDKAKKGAFKDSVYGMMDAAEITIASKELEMPVTFVYPLVEGYPIIEMKGQKPQDGYMEVNKQGQMKIELTDGTWCAKKEFTDSEVTITKGSCVVGTDPSLFMMNEAGDTITGYTGTLTDIIIPSRINGKTITTIGVKAFRDKKLTSVIIPSGITTIEEEAFYYNQLTDLTLPDGVVMIGASSFDQNKIVNLSLPNGLITISAYAFRGNQLTNVVIPDSVVTIDSYAFSYNQLTNVTLPKRITTISEAAFFRNQLTSIVIPNSVTTIKNGAFQNNKLTNVMIPSNVKIIENLVFYDNQLTSVKIKEKSRSSQFTTYGSMIWGWKTGYSDTNITWNA